MRAVTTNKIINVFGFIIGKGTTLTFINGDFIICSCGDKKQQKLYIPLFPYTSLGVNASDFIEEVIKLCNVKTTRP